MESHKGELEKWSKMSKDRDGSGERDKLQCRVLGSRNHLTNRSNANLRQATDQLSVKTSGLAWSGLIQPGLAGGFKQRGECTSRDGEGPPLPLLLLLMVTVPLAES